MAYEENNLEAFNAIVKALQGLEVEVQKRTLSAVITFLNINSLISDQPTSKLYEPRSNGSSSFLKDTSFSENRDISPKEFLREKQPQTDVERVTCLAYYLTHYRATQFFKTLEISSLNTESAQPKLSNPTYAVDNASKAGLLVQGERGSKQISAAGELFVQALPDRDAAKASIANIRLRRRGKKTNRNSEVNQ